MVSKGGAVAITVIVVIFFSCVVSCGFYYWLEKCYNVTGADDGYQAAQSNEAPNNDASNDIEAAPAPVEAQKEEVQKEEAAAHEEVAVAVAEPDTMDKSNV